MKIAVILPSNSEALFNRNSEKAFGGGDVQMYQLAKELAHCVGVNCFTFIEDYEIIDFDEESQFELVKTYKKSDRALVKFWKYHRRLQRLKPEVVLQQGLTLFSSLLAVYCRFFKINFVYMFAHDNEALGRYQESSKKSPVFGWLLDNARVLITQNLYQKEQLLKRYGKSSIVIRNGFYLKNRPSSCGEYVLWVARHSSWKHPELFIRLAAQNPQLHFKMVCPASLAPNYNELALEAARVANLEFIKFVPFDKIDSYFEKAKIFVNTSEYEGFPQTFIHAAMNSVPVLSLEVNPDQVLTENNFGFCCGGSIEELNQKLNLLVTDNTLYQKMSENAFHYAEKNHDIRKNVRQILELIERAK